MKTLIVALALVFALAGGISIMALAFGADFRGPAADNGGSWTTTSNLARASNEARAWLSRMPR
jgi:hypothetical protein